MHRIWMKSVTCVRARRGAEVPHSAWQMREKCHVGSFIRPHLTSFLPFLPQSRPFPRPYRAQSPSRSPRQNNETPPRPSGRSRPEHTPVAAVHLGSVVRSIAANQGHRNEYSFRLRLRPDRPAVRPADRPTDRQTAGHDDEVIN